MIIWKHREIWEKVTTRSQVSVYRTNDPMVTIAAIDLKHDKMAVIPIYGKKKSLCPVTILVDSQVSDRCPWATCYLFWSDGKKNKLAAIKMCLIREYRIYLNIHHNMQAKIN